MSPNEWDEVMYERREAMLKDALELIVNPVDIVDDDGDGDGDDDNYDFQDAQVVTPDNIFIYERPEFYLDDILMQSCEVAETDGQEEEEENDELAWGLPTTSRACRHRYLSEYKEKKLCCATDADRELIAQCKTVRPWGDCKLDAELYLVLEEDVRTDVKTYIWLYGLYPWVVRAIDYTPTIMVLNEYATVIASENHAVTPTFHRRFAAFISALEEEGYAPGYTDRQTSGSYQAYSAFLDALETESWSIAE